MKIFPVRSPSSATSSLTAHGSAVALMAFGMLTIPIMDVIAKVLTMDGMPGTQVALARFVSQGILTLFLMPFASMVTGSWSVPRSGGPLRSTLVDLRHALTLLNAGRGVVLAAATGFFFTGLRHLPLPESAAILFLTPLILILLAAVVLGERVTRTRLLMCLMGFASVLLIVRPGTGGMGLAALLPLAAAVCFAAYFLLTRMAAGQGSPLAMHVIAALVGTVFLTIILPLVGASEGGNVATTWPTEPQTWFALATLGVVSTISHMAIIVAFARAPASVLAPLSYLEIVSATALSFLVFGTLPDVWTVIGALLISLIGLAVARGVGAD